MENFNFQSCNSESASEMAAKFMEWLPNSNSTFNFTEKELILCNVQNKFDENPFKVSGIGKYYDFLFLGDTKTCPCGIKCEPTYQAKGSYLIHCYIFHTFGFGDFQL